MLCAAGAGCTSMRDRGLPDSVIRATDPAMGRPYLLYRPANYDRERAWPLVIACGGGFGESPQTQIRRWRPLADKHGFLVAAPTLLGGDKVRALADDERHIRSTIGHVQAGQSISDDRVLMYGQGAGALPALVTALGFADRIRCTALADPRFRVDDLEAMGRRVDPQMMIYIRYNIRDAFLGNHVRDSVDWLRANGANLRADTFGADPETGLQRVVEFYQHAIRTEPWRRIQSGPTGAADVFGRAGLWQQGGHGVDARNAAGLRPGGV
jgi:pimeloyl-ACP methyl ester carboxylesterase